MSETKKCPYCGEEIKAEAKKCRYCGQWIEEGQSRPEEPQVATKSQTEESKPQIEAKPVEQPRQEEPIEEDNESTQAKNPTKVCPNCGQEIALNAKKCRHCGQWLEKQCPYCGEWINVNANKCKHCGNWLSEIARRKYENSTGITRDRERTAAEVAAIVKSKEKEKTGCFEKFGGCVLAVENLILCLCLMVAYDLNFWVFLLILIVLTVLLSFGFIRAIYKWFLIVVWGAFGYGVGGWVGAIVAGLLSFAIHSAADKYEEVQNKE